MINYRKLALKYLILTHLTEDKVEDILKENVIKLLKENNIKADSSNSDQLVEVFRLGFENGWWLSLDENLKDK